MVTSIDITVDYGLMKILMKILSGYYRHTQRPEKLDVWADVLNKILIEPYFIEGNLTSAKYKDMLRNQIFPVIQAIIGKNFDQI